MAFGRELKIMVGIIAAILVAIAVYQAEAVFAPLALALFIIAIVWPLQSRLQSRLPKLLALAVCMIVIIAVCVAFGSLAVWAVGRVAQSMIADSTRYQALYDKIVGGLEVYGISVESIWAEHFNVLWMLRALQHISGRLNTMVSFWVIGLLYVLLGLLEVEIVGRNIAAMDFPVAARVLLDGSLATAAKFRKYLLVRTQMSLLTGLLVTALAWITGLQFALEWGVIAFVLNYIPFIGPFIATILPTVVAMTQFATWQAVLATFVALNAIQFIVGSYVEPRISGSKLSISPSVVLFAVLFWTFLWGLFGAFIGVPIVITILTFCEKHPSSCWLAHLLGNPAPMSRQSSG